MKLSGKGNIFLSLIVTLSLLAGLIPLVGNTAQAAAKPKATATALTVQSKTMAPLGVVTTDITLTGYSGALPLAAYDLRVNFDNTKLSYTSIAAGDAGFSIAASNLINGGTTLTFSSFSGNSSGPTIRLATITWTGLAGFTSGSTTLTPGFALGGALADSDGADLSPMPAAVAGTLSILAPPVASFTYLKSPTSGATPCTVAFTDTSTGPPSSWSWTFGDGTTSTLQNPSKVYNTAGAYTVNLTVNNSVGPASSTSQTISIYSVPVASFTKSASSGTAPFGVNFTDTSTGNIVSWLWAFGDGTTSTAQNPSKTYSTAGNFTVTLTATNPAGSATSPGQVVNSYSVPVASFTKSASSGNTPLTVNMTDTSTGNIVSWLWTFGDGTTSALQNPSKTYTTAGNFTVTLQVTNPAGTNTSAGQTVTVYSTPVASFTKSASSGNAPLTVNMTDTSTGNIVSWLWTFGDGTTSALQNPSKTYTTAGNYTVTLQATNPAGTNTSAGQVISVYSTPAASFTKSVSSGNTPFDVNFTDTSTGNVTGWTWNFGDGTTSTAQNPVKTYTTAGNFTVTLTATNPAGSNTSAGQTINSYSTPVANFTASPTSTNPGATIAFTDTSTGNIVSWSWNFGDATTSTLQNPTKSYAADGSYTVSLHVMNPAGGNTVTKTAYITIVSYKAETAMLNSLDTATSNYVYIGAQINRFFNPVTGTTVTLDGISAFDAYVSYPAAGISVKNVVGLGIFAGPTNGKDIADAAVPGGTKTTVNGFSAASSVAPSAELFRVYPQLIGSKDVPVTATLHFNTIARQSGGEIPQDADASKTFRRGDANGSGSVSITDALFIAQLLAGLRTVGEATGNVNPVNAATPRNDSATLGSSISITDALYVAQMLAGLRDASYNFIV